MTKVQMVESDKEDVPSFSSCHRSCATFQGGIKYCLEQNCGEQIKNESESCMFLQVRLVQQKSTGILQFC